MSHTAISTLNFVAPAARVRIRQLAALTLLFASARPVSGQHNHLEDVSCGR